MQVQTSLVLFGVVILTISFIDPSETLRCLSVQCLSLDASKNLCYEVNPDQCLIMDECKSCGESFTKDPVGKLIVLRTCEIEPCMNGKDGLVHLKGPQTFAAIRCCHEDLCNNGTMPTIPFSDEIPVIEGVEDMEQHSPGKEKH